MTGSRADQIRTLASQLTQGVTDLQETLVRVVRTAMPEVNRRAHPRFELDAHAKVMANRGNYDGEVTDISVGGVRIKGITSIAPGEKCTVRVDDLEMPLTVIDSHDGVTRFRLDPNAEPTVGKWIERNQNSKLKLMA